MENQNKPYYIIGASVLSGLTLAILIQQLKKLRKSSQTSKVEIITVLDRRCKRKNSGLPTEYNRIKLSGNAKFSKDNALVEELNFLDTPTCEIYKVNHLAWDMKMFEFPDIVSPLLSVNSNFYRGIYGGEGFLPEQSFVSKNSFVLSVPNFNSTNSIDNTVKWLTAGPRKNLFFKPEEVKAAIVTCGGICPGVNVVIREIVMSLYYNYKVHEIYGIPHGYKGFYSEEWIQLKPDKIKTLHHFGGTFLGTSRGGFDLDKILEALLKKGINQVYVIGGIGSIKAADILYQEIRSKKLKIGISIIPKSIGNDIPIIDDSFGFETCIENAQRAIRAAYTESRSYEYGIGIVKLIGRYSGFIAMESTLASRDVNICLVPEFGFELHGDKGLLEYIFQRLKMRKFCLIVVAEGAGDSLLDDTLPDRGYDESGNLKPGDIAAFLKEKLLEYFKFTEINPTIKYIDPTFFIRAVEANALDKKLCTRLAQNSVHSTMAGFTGCVIGKVNKSIALIRTSEILDEKYSTQILPTDANWLKLLAATGQPSFIADESVYAELNKE